MAQPQRATVVPEQRCPERQALARCISQLAAAESDLSFTQDAAHTAQQKKWAAQRALDAIKEEASKQGDGDLAQLMIEAARAGKEITPSALNAASEEVAQRIKVATQEAELFGRASIELELKLTAKATAVEQCRHKLRDAAKAVIVASDAFVRICNDLEVLQAEAIRKRVILRFFLSVAPAPSAADKRIEALLLPEIPPHPKQPTYENWEAHPSYIEWANV